MIDGPELDGNSGRRQPVESSIFAFVLYHVGSHVPTLSLNTGARCGHFPWRHYIPGWLQKDRFCTHITIVAKLLGKPDDEVGRCEWERVGCVWRHRYLQQLASLLCTISMRFDITRSDQRSYTVTSLFVRFSVAATPAVDSRYENVTRWHESGEGSDWERCTFQSPSYIPPQLLLGRLRTRISPRGGSTGHRPSAQLVTNRYLNMVTNLHIAGPKPSRVGPPLRTRSRAIPI